MCERIYVWKGRWKGRGCGGEWRESRVEVMCEEMVYGSGILRGVWEGRSVGNN